MCVNKYDTCFRLKLDRRRLEEAHVKICTVTVFQNYPDTFSQWSISSDIQDALDTVTPAYYEAFSALYAGKCFV